MTGFNEFLGNAHDQMTVERVYGTPYEADGVVFIPAASVKGGLGGGEGEGNETTLRSWWWIRHFGPTDRGVSHQW